jgi:thiamine-monophosphate kinase
VAGFISRMKSEFEFIKRIRAAAARHSISSNDLICGIGDDTAIIGEHEGRETLITTDLLVEDVDFKLGYAPPHSIGHKALAVSLSDIAAMGGAPRYSLLTLGIPYQSSEFGVRSSESEKFWDEFFEGYFALAEKCGVALVGGDISSTPGGLVIDSMVIGHCQKGQAVRRSGARVGDSIYITGEIGASAAGLELLRRGERMNEGTGNHAQKALRAHLMPEAQIEFGRKVGESSLAHAMIDVSDGLAQDLAHICEESRVKAVIDYEAVPVADELRLATESRDAAFMLAISGGEDYELLLTAGQQAEADLMEISRACQVRLTRIGETTAISEAGFEPTLRLRRDGRLESLEARGYDHFAQR